MSLPTPNDINGTFCGFRATQVWQDFWLWEQILNDTADTLVGIVELGTAYGGFSLFLQMQAWHRRLEFATFDSVDHAYDPLDQLFGRPTTRPQRAPLVFFYKTELLSEPALEVKRWLDHGPVILFCDNGNKAKEVRLYGPLLAPGSLCVVHDWKREIFPEDIPPWLTEVYGDLCDQIGSWSRVFVLDTERKVC